ncbi:MAG: sigma-70 family RNA polymerase sigma factor [Vicingaceae bacterium]|jgi:RNA polymerase sigma factor (sigma-70 family)
MQKEKERHFLDVIEKNKNSILRICEVYASKYEEPNDLFQEVVYNIWKSYSTFNNKSDIDTWVYRITLNVCMRAQLNINKKTDNHFKGDSIQINQISSEDLDDSKTERHEALRHCISKLKETDKSIVLLYLEDIAYSQISEITGLTENHIAVKMKRIKKSLLKCITANL